MELFVLPALHEFDLCDFLFLSVNKSRCYGLTSYDLTWKTLCNLAFN